MPKALRHGAPMIVTLAILGLLIGCGDGESTSTAPTTSARCGDQEQDCTPAEVIAAAERYYALGGATPAEAACLAPITGTGKHAVNEAFEAPTDAQTRAAIECVGSATRLRVIAEGVARYATAQVPAPEVTP